MTYLNHEEHARSPSRYNRDCEGWKEPKDINKLYQKRKFSNLHQPADGGNQKEYYNNQN